jgi:rhodanese-related sulfurtransferase
MSHGPGQEAGINPDWECSPRQVLAMLQNAESGLVLVDCRTDAEWDQARIEGAVLIPLQEMHERVDELRPYDDGRPLVVYCHHGRRSLRAAAILREAGMTGALSMAGGIDRWSLEIDSSVPRYTK